MENKRMSELPVATVVNDEDYTVIVQGGVNKRASKGIFKQKDYNNLNNRPYINSTYSSSLNPANELMQGNLQFHKISKTGKYSDLLDLPFIATKLSELTNDGYFVQDRYYVHTDNNLTNGLLGKIDSAIQAIKINDTLLTPNENQEINIDIPINLTDLTNDGYFVQDANYVHTDNNFTTILKNNYDNIVANVNQPVSSTNKLITMNDLLALDTGYWVVIDLYQNIVFDGVINVGEDIPTIGNYAVIEGTENLTISKYTNGISDELNLPIKDGYFVFVNGNETDLIYYIKENSWKKLSTDLSNYYKKQESDNRYVLQENGKGLMTNAERTKLSGISTNANKVEKSNTNGNIKVDGTEVQVYSLTSAEIISVLGYTPISDLSDYYNKQQSDNRYIQKEEGKGLITDSERTKLTGISTGANKVQSSNTNGNIRIDGVETVVFSLTKGEVIAALGYTPIEATADLSDYYDKQQSDNRYVQKENDKELISTTEKTKLSGISTGANKVEKSNTNGNIKIDGVEKTVYSLTSAEIISVLGYTPISDLSNYYNKTQSDNRYVQKETGKELITTAEKTKLSGISTGANKIESSTTNGNIKIDGTETQVYSLTSAEIISVLGYTPVHDLSSYYNKTQTDNRYVQKETGKELITTAEKTKLSGISSGANKVENSATNGNIKIDGTDVNVYSLTQADVVSVLGFTPIEITSAEKTKLSGISTGANKVESSTTNGKIKIDGVETTVYSLTKSAVTTALGYTPPKSDVATTSKNGLLSSTDKQKLDGLDDTYLKKNENAVSATKLYTARKINGVNFDGTADINIDIGKEFYYASVPMAASLADMYAEQSLPNILGSGYHLEGRRYSGDSGNNTLAYIYIVRDSRTYMSGYLKVNAYVKSDVEYDWDYPEDSRDSESRLWISDWGDEVYISIEGNPQNCKKIEYSVSTSRYGYNWQTGSSGNVSTSATISVGSFNLYYINVKITFNDNTSVIYSQEWYGGGGGGLACFTADTLIDTKNGKVRIGNIKEGDLILSCNQEYNSMQYKDIKKVYSHEVNVLIYITINGKILKTTWSHPFFVVGKGMVKAYQLLQHDIVRDCWNRKYHIESIEIVKEKETVYEILVKDNKNYFVGKDSIFVGCEDIENL